MQKGVLRADRKKHGIKAIVTIRSPFQVEWRIMGIENEVAETPREPVTRDTDDKLPKFKERTLQRSNFDRQSRELPEPRTKLLEPAEIWRATLTPGKIYSNVRGTADHLHERRLLASSAPRPDAWLKLVPQLIARGPRSQGFPVFPGSAARLRLPLPAQPLHQ